MINSLQILRAFAAFAVFFTHYALFGLHVGGFGVDIFFIISGFVIAFVIKKSTADFLIKRIIRVAPLYTIATLFTASLAFIKPEWFKSVVLGIEPLLKSLLYIPYKIEKSGPILSLGWTLNFEMFFYLVMAICIFLFRKSKYIIQIAILIFGLFLVLINVIKVENYPLNFYANGLLPEFIMGLFLFFVWQKLQKLKDNKINITLFILAILAIVFLVSIGITKDFSDYNRNIRTGIPCFLIVLGFMAIEPFINPEKKWVKFFSLVGDSSYAMYLFHPFVLFGCTRVLFPLLFGKSDLIIVEIIKFLIVSTILIIVSILIYKFIDKLLNNYLRKKIVN